MLVGGRPSALAQTPCPANGAGDRSSVVIYVDGQPSGEIGASMLSAEFVGATALYIQRKGRQGNLNTFLYKQGAAQRTSGASCYHTAIPGFDGKWSETYPAGGYDYLVGNGTPIVRNLFGFTDLLAAGDPQTPSNPQTRPSPRKPKTYA
jgi:hypothetical protein